MKLICTLLLSLAILPSLFADETFTLTVTVTNIPGAEGNLLVGIYDKAESFTDAPLAISPKIAVTSTEDVVAKVESLKPGTYAVAVIQDLNGNGELDRNFLGMPKEPLAFSVITAIPKGKPDFAACSFEIKDADVAMTIPLVVK